MKERKLKSRSCQKKTKHRNFFKIAPKTTSQKKTQRVSTAVIYSETVEAAKTRGQMKAADHRCERASVCVCVYSTEVETQSLNLQVSTVVRKKLPLNREKHGPGPGLTVQCWPGPAQGCE